VTVLAAPPGILIGLVGQLLVLPWIGLALVALWAAAAAAISGPLLGLAARAVSKRRENLALVAGGK